MSDFDKWFFNIGGDCYGSNSEEYKISKVTRDYQKKKIDAVLNAVDKYKYSSGERILEEVRGILNE